MPVFLPISNRKVGSSILLKDFICFVLTVMRGRKLDGKARHGAKQDAFSALMRVHGICISRFVFLIALILFPIFLISPTDSLLTFSPFILLLSLFFRVPALTRSLLFVHLCISLISSLSHPCLHHALSFSVYVSFLLSILPPVSLSPILFLPPFVYLGC